MTEPSSGYQRYNRAKGWKHMVCGAGLEGASALINDLQRVERDNTTQILNVLLAEKAILKGCEFIFIDDINVTISAGQVLVNGIVHDVTEQSFSITGIGTEIVGLRVELSVKDHNDDVDLLDPAEGFAGYGAPYARVETYTTTWLINDGESFAFFELEDGILQLLNPLPQIEGITNVLARRTFDENNHFRVSGLTASIAEKDNENMLLKISSGKAYVLGYEIIIPADRNITTPKSQTTLPITNEFHTFQSGVSLYQLGTVPVKQVVQITANIQVTGETVNRSNYPPTIADQLSKVNVTKILSVTQTGNPDSPFVEGTDFVLTNNSVDWTPSLSGGSRPANGSQYVVTFLYQKVLVKGVRVKIDVVEQIAKGSANGQDNLSHGDIIANTVVVSKGATTYALTTDYLVVEAKGATTGGRINWSPGGIEPSPSENYSVSYSYWEHDTEGDYTAYDSYDTLLYAPDRNAVDFAPAGDNPYVTAPYNTFSIDYDYYLSRRDVVVLDRSGEMLILQGEPEFFHPQPPLIPADTLGLCEVRYPPDSASVVIISFDNMVVQQPELQQFRRRILSLEFDVGQKDLDQKARTRLPGQALKGIWTDNFTDMDKADWTFPNFDVLYSVDDGVISLPRDMNQYEGVVNTNPQITTAVLHKNVIIVPYTNVILISQLHASEAINVNPYDVFGLRPNIALTPDHDMISAGISVTLLDPQAGQQGWIPTIGSVFAWEAWWLSYRQTLPQDLPGINLTFVQFLTLNGITPAIRNALLSRQMASVTATILDSSGIIIQVRSRVVRILGDRFTPNANNLAATFDGIPVSLTPVAPTSLAGTTPGTIRANAAGEAEGDFTIPTGLTGGGGKVVTLGNIFESAGATYVIAFSTGLNLTFVLESTYVDPIAQTFVLTDDRFITGVRIWFKKKSTSQGVEVQLRTVGENGEPTNVILGRSKLKPIAVSVSNNASLFTTFMFEEPAFLKKGMYCFTIFSPSNEYEVWVGRGGYFDITNNQPIRVNPYGPGVLFLSANNRTWTPDQAADMKFQILAATFNQNAVVKWNDVSSVSMTSFMLLANQTIPTGTRLLWQYSVNNGTSWIPTSLLQLQGLTKDHSNITLSVRALFYRSSNGWLSPILHRRTLHIITYRNKLTGLYANFNNELPDPQTYTTLKVWFQAFIPSGTTVQLYYSANGGQNWTEMTSPATTSVDEIFTEYAYSVTGLSPAKTQFKFKITLSTGSAPTQRIVVPLVRRLQSLVY